MILTDLGAWFPPEREEDRRQLGEMQLRRVKRRRTTPKRKRLMPEARDNEIAFPRGEALWKEEMGWVWRCPQCAGEFMQYGDLTSCRICGTEPTMYPPDLEDEEVA